MFLHDRFHLPRLQSPRRKQLLEQWGVRCELLLPDAEEDAEALEVVLPGEAPAAYVQRVTNLKLAASMARLKRRGLPLAPVLCADTTVALGRRILGKPADAAEARAMLGRSGRTSPPGVDGGGRGQTGASAARRGNGRPCPRPGCALSRSPPRRFSAMWTAVSPWARRVLMRFRARRRCGPARSAAAIPASWACLRLRRPRCSRAAGVHLL